MLCQHNYLITFFTFGGCGDLVRTDFQEFPPGEDVVVLKTLISNNLHFGRCDGHVRTDLDSFNFGGCGSLERTDFE